MKSVMIANPPEDDAERSLEGCIRGLKQAGTAPFVSLSPEDVSKCCGLILPGGPPDVDPELYGEKNTACMVVDRQLDDIQLSVLDAAVKLEKPILAFCRGAQLMNVYFGGSLIQHLDTTEVHKYVAGEETLHDSICVPGTCMYQLYGPHAVINTKHHQAVRRLPDCMEISQLWFSSKVDPQARAEVLQRIQAGESVEGSGACVVECYCHKDRPILGIQWHPEMMLMRPTAGTADPMKVFHYFAGLLSQSAVSLVG